MYDLVPNRALHMTSRCVSWTPGSPAAHHLLVCSSHPPCCLTITSKRYFSSALSSISQLSTSLFPAFHFFFCLSLTPFPSLRYSFRKCWPLIAPKRSPQAGCGWDTHCFPAVLIYRAPRPGPFMPSTAQTQGKMSAWTLLTMCLKGSRHDNAVPHHT